LDSQREALFIYTLWVLFLVAPLPPILAGEGKNISFLMQVIFRVYEWAFVALCNFIRYWFFILKLCSVKKKFTDSEKWQKNRGTRTPLGKKIPLFPKTKMTGLRSL
jgi:hypothetical protein